MTPMMPQPQNRPQPVSLLMWVWRILSIIAAVIIIWKSLQPPGGSPGLTHIDKVQHLAAYAVLTGLVLLSRWGASTFWLVITIIAFSGVMEIMQGLMGWGRTASFADLAANALGALLIWGLLALIRKTLGLSELI